MCCYGLVFGSSGGDSQLPQDLILGLEFGCWFGYKVIAFGLCKDWYCRIL